MAIKCKYLDRSFCYVNAPKTPRNQWRVAIKNKNTLEWTHHSDVIAPKTPESHRNLIFSKHSTIHLQQTRYQATVAMTTFRIKTRSRSRMNSIFCIASAPNAISTHSGHETSKKQVWPEWTHHPITPSSKSTFRPKQAVPITSTMARYSWTKSWLKHYA